MILKKESPMNDASVVKTVVDICSRSFTILSDEGDVQLVYCNSVQEFMDVYEVCKTFMEDDMMIFTEISIEPRANRKTRKRKKPDEKV